MHMDPECVPCLLHRVVFQTELVAPDRSLEVMRNSLAILCREFREGVNSAKLATEVHRRAYLDIGSSDPYRELKRRADEIALSLLPRAEAFIDASENRIRAAVICAIAGNVMDFGIGKGFDRPEDLLQAFDSIVAQPLGVDDLPRVTELLANSSRVLYLLDNCGEQVFDRLLVREIQAMGTTVVGVVKGEPVLTDVTREDAERLSHMPQFDHMVDTGTFAVGVSLERMGRELREEMEAADLIVAKGMANFEALSDRHPSPIVYIMRAKCRPVARSVGARKDDNVVRLYE